MKKTKDNFNYIIGTQAFDPNYQFTEIDPLLEMAERIYSMGSNAFKFRAEDDETIDRVLKEYPFKYIFMWYRSNPWFKNEYREEEARADYDAIYRYTCKLLTKYNNSGIEFYIGHWEGDWYYIDDYNIAQKKVDPGRAERMIQWMNNRQRAVEDARKDTPHTNVEVWNYMEVNRPTDAVFDKTGEVDRVINRVIPYTNVDYLSYSAYDCMELPLEEIRQVIDEMYRYLPAKEGIPGPRIFISEFGMPLSLLEYDIEKHAVTNMRYFAKYLHCNVKFILFWQIYCNEKMEDGSSRGFWLINDKNEEQPLYRELKSVFWQSRSYLDSYCSEYGRLPENEEFRAFLLTCQELKNT